MKIGFIGLGVMGGPMAINLLQSRAHQIRVFDIDPARAENLRALGATPVDSIRAASINSDIVMTSLPGPKQIAEIAFGEQGLVSSLPAGAIWVDLSTNNLATAHDIAAAAQTAGIKVLDAPVSGGDEGARAGSLTVLVGGEESIFNRCKSVLEIIGGQVSHLGAHGAGYSAKIAQVVLCYLHSLALSEALMLGVKGGVDPDQMLMIIQNSTGHSYAADRYGPPILAGDYDPSFTLGLALKDLNLARGMAQDLGLKLPICDLTTETYARAVEVYGFDANHLKAVRLLEQENNTFLQSNGPN